MNRDTLLVFKSLMTRGYISKESDAPQYNLALDDEVAQELEIMERELDFKLWRTQNRIYLIPNQTNELFLQNNRDFRKRVATDARLEDIYLFNYIAIYLLYMFYHGSGDTPKCRDFIKTTDFIADFTNHCEQIKKESEKLDNSSQVYSMDFIRLADKWLAKTGEINNSLDTKYGCAMKIIRFLRDEELFTDDDNRLKPTKKLDDLMPYFLSKSRINEINSIFKGGEEDAGN